MIDESRIRRDGCTHAWLAQSLQENVERADSAVESSPNENDCVGHDSVLLAAVARGRGSAGAKLGCVQAANRR